MLHNYHKIKDKGLLYWLPQYLRYLLKKKQSCHSGGPIHVALCIVDHFEPFYGNVDQMKAKWRVEQWVRHYPAIAEKHRDADGVPLQHTWFYPPHLDHCFLKNLVSLSQGGYGEIEMHLHHNHMKPFPDTSDTLCAKIEQCKDDYSKHGIFCLPGGHRRFAFVHGDWSLANSRGPSICGVNDEVTILKNCGCYADFTFPCLNQAQPRMVNTIYYAKGSKNIPKSYDSGCPVAVNHYPPQSALMLIQGIIGVRLDRKKKYNVAIEYSDLTSSDPLTPNRINYLVKNALTIKGVPNWKFIKIHTHGAVDENMEANFGKVADVAFSYFEKNYNDGKNYILHYVTAREMYNLIKSIEAGEQKYHPSFRDYEIKKYAYTKND